MRTGTRQPLREQHLERTRTVILAAFAACLEKSISEDVSVADIAAEAGVSERTIYRHYPTRDDLVAGLHHWSRSNENYGALIEVPTLEDLPAIFAEVVERWEHHPGFTRGLVHTSIGRRLSQSLAGDVDAQLLRAIDASLPRIPAAERRRLHALLGYLDSAHAWVVMHDRYGLSAREIGEVIGRTMRVVIDDATRRYSVVPADPGGA